MQDHTRVHRESPVADLHCDTFLQMRRGYDLSQRHDTYHVDIPRLKEGGVDLQVFAVSLNPFVADADPFGTTMKGIAFITSQLARFPDDIELCRTAADWERVRATGRISALLAIEGGTALDNDPANLARFYDQGIRIITIIHERPTGWCSHWRETGAGMIGLSDLGRDIIAEMNRLGIIIDLSHSSDATVDAVLAASTAPVIASHSNARTLCNHRRNLTDDQIIGLARTGGLIGVTFVNSFLSETFRAAMEDYWARIPGERRQALTELFVSEIPEAEMRKQWTSFADLENDIDTRFAPLRTTVKTVVDHIDYIISLVGPDHVGLGSDFDGMSMPPLGLEDCAGMPGLTEELFRRGYGESDVGKILGGNFLRVFRDVCG